MSYLLEVKTVVLIEAAIFRSYDSPWHPLGNFVITHPFVLPVLLGLPLHLRTLRPESANGHKRCPLYRHKTVHSHRQYGAAEKHNQQNQNCLPEYSHDRKVTFKCQNRKISIPSSLEKICMNRAYIQFNADFLRHTVFLLYICICQANGGSFA